MEDALVAAIAEEMRAQMSGESSGHDWWHVYRVRKLAEHIGAEEGADMRTVSLAALLHDIADAKFHDGDEAIGPRKAKELLLKHGAPADLSDRVAQIISEMDFRGAEVAVVYSTIEARVVQDADWLDAVGAIGIGRTFAYGGLKGRVMYDPNIKPELHTTAEAYRNNKSPSVNHFYEKLLLLKDRMNTKTGSKIAEARHVLMEEYLKHFFAEWEGKE